MLPVSTLVFAVVLSAFSTPTFAAPLAALPQRAIDQVTMGSNQGLEFQPTIYFGYGSNLWLHQMDLRCPTSHYLGVARLDGYRWIINDRGYANVVQVDGNNTHSDEPLGGADSVGSDYATSVFGLVYALQPSDEAQLDRNEGVPIAYTKEHIPNIKFWASKGGKREWVDVTKEPTDKVKMLVYIDRKRTNEDDPREEYVYRMNRGIEDARSMGVPDSYIKIMRRFIPAEENEGRKSLEEWARKQAGGFKDESGVFQEHSSQDTSLAP